MGGGSTLLVSLCYLCVTKIAADIDMDYYLGYLRSSCLGRKGENICQIDCQGALSICFQGQCICDTKTANPIEQALWGSDTKKFVKEVDNLIDFPGDQRAGILLVDGIKEIEVMSADDYVATVSKSVLLRHHIAHFCPNLEVARKCIRKCMKFAKPAFCGKDHVCYCGHRYSHHDTEPKIDPDAVMNSFRDLYEKYFGRNPNEPGNTIIEEEHHRKHNKKALRTTTQAKTNVGRKKSKNTNI